MGVLETKRAMIMECNGKLYVLAALDVAGRWLTVSLANVYYTAFVVRRGVKHAARSYSHEIDILLMISILCTAGVPAPAPVASAYVWQRNVLAFHDCCWSKAWRREEGRPPVYPPNIGDITKHGESSPKQRVTIRLGGFILHSHRATCCGACIHVIRFLTEIWATLYKVVLPTIPLSAVVHGST